MLLLYLGPDPPPLPPRQLKKPHPKSLPLPSVECPLPPPLPPRGEYDSAPSGLSSRFPTHSLPPSQQRTGRRETSRPGPTSTSSPSMLGNWSTWAKVRGHPRTHAHRNTHTHTLSARPLLFSIYQQLQARRTCRGPWFVRNAAPPCRVSVPCT